ncbi:MAG TPA: hypothetical protein VHF22_00290 [Planctomycetota bacterium]|nr:hypothetical protein [Planctomycetota bacterium]
MPYTTAQFNFSKLTGNYKTLFAADAKDRGKYLSLALKRSETDFDTILLFYLALDFKAAPTKTKFYVIYDAYFLDQIARMNDVKKKRGKDVPDSKRTPTKFPMPIGHNYSHTYTQLDRLAEMAEVVEALSDIAKNKNFLDRILTSSARKIPGDLFDDLIAEIVDKRGKDTLADELNLNLKSEPAFEDLDSIMSGKITQVNPNFQKDLKTAQTALADLLKKAGFDVKKLGISDMKAP